MLHKGPFYEIMAIELNEQYTASDQCHYQFQIYDYSISTCDEFDRYENEKPYVTTITLCIFIFNDI
jgi:hypothetical protein